MYRALCIMLKMITMSIGLTNRKRLQKENEELGLKIENNKFYKDFLYKTIMFCREKYNSGQKEFLNEFLSDECFVIASKYSKLLPKHILFICFLLDIE